MGSIARLPHVVIIGGGFGGLYAARALRDAPVRITLLDRQNHHLFQPLLYQVASAGLNASDIAAPIRWILRRQSNATVLLANVVAIDPPARRVVLNDGDVSYDYLIVASGATHSYFGHDDWEQHAPGLKTIVDALEIRRRVLFAFEAAERESDPTRRVGWLTFVVIGGGPTGVEMAGALAEVARNTLAQDFRNIDPTKARVILLEGLPQLLPSYPSELRDKAAQQLARLGVEVKCNSRVTGIGAHFVSLGEESIVALTVIWAAGVKASSLGRSLNVPLDGAGRVKVTQYLTVPEHDEIFVIGDLASFEQDGRPIPGVAPAAMQMGRHAAHNIVRAVRGRELRVFHYVDRGLLATVGRSLAVAEVGGLRLSGWIAWMAWLITHIFFLIGFRNRVVVLINWAWAYVTFQRGSRIITGSPLPEAETPPLDSEASPGTDGRGL